MLHRLFVGTTTKKKVFDYLTDLSQRLINHDEIGAAAVFGSISRGSLKSTSDIDISFIRRPGFINAVKSILFLVKEKRKTNFNLLPIEAYLADSVQYMKKRYRADEIPVVIKNENNVMDLNYSRLQTITDAMTINNYSFDE